MELEQMNETAQTMNSPIRLHSNKRQRNNTMSNLTVIYKVGETEQIDYNCWCPN